MSARRGLTLTLVRALGVRGLGAVLTAGLAVYVARLFGVSYSGQFYFLYSTIAVGGIVTRLGAEQYLTTRVSSLVREGQQASGNILFGSFIANAVIIVCLAPFAVAVSSLTISKDAGLANSLPHWSLLLAAIFAFNVIWVSAAHTRSHGHIESSMILESVLVPGAFGALMMVSQFRNGPPSSNDVALTVIVLGLGVGIAACTRYPPNQISEVARQVVPALMGAARFSSVTLTNGILVWAPVQALGFLATSADVANYNAGFRVTMLVGSLGTMIKGVAIRRALSASGAPEHAAASRMVWTSVGIALLLALASTPLLFARSTVAALFGDGFDNAGIILPIMLLAQCVNVGFYLVETSLVLRHQHRVLAVNAALVLLVALALPPLVLEFGTLGAAWSFALLVMASRFHMSMGLVRASRRVAVS